MDIDRINKVIDYMTNIIRKTSSIDKLYESVESIDNNKISVEKKRGGEVKEDYGAERYLFCNPNMLYRYASRSFIEKSNYKVNKAAYKEAAKKYGRSRFNKKNYFEESYI